MMNEVLKKETNIKTKKEKKRLKDWERNNALVGRG